MTSDEASTLFDSDNKSAELKTSIILKKLMAYLREVLSKSFVKQKLAEVLKLDSKIVDELLIQRVVSPTHPNEKMAIDEFLDSAFSESNTNVNLTADAFQDQFKSFVLLHKIALIISKFKVKPKQVKWLFSYGPEIDWLNLNLLHDPVISISSRFAGWERLVDVFELRKRIRNAETAISDVLASAHDPDANVGDLNKKEADLIDRLSENTGWNKDDLLFLTGTQGFDFEFPKDYKNELALIQIKDCFKMMKKLGVSAQQCIAYAKPTLTQEESSSIRQAVKAKYQNEQWLDIAKPLQDILREKKRSSLVAYLLTNPNPKKNQKWNDVNALYAHFLIDVEMSPCQLTSRIKQANSSIQQFVQRCFLSVEDEVSTSIMIDNSVILDEKWLEWKWMKNYRVWEANRKIFLFPENWTEPELPRSRLQVAILQGDGK